MQVCLECDRVLHGRSDKKFCDNYCRNAYHNRTRRDHDDEIKQTNKALRRNRTILKTLSPLGKTTVRKEVMEAMGYDFSVFTSMYRTSKGNLYYMCYEFGFNPIIDQKKVEKAVIINRQDYMDRWKPWQYVKNP